MALDNSCCFPRSNTAPSPCTSPQVTATKITPAPQNKCCTGSSTKMLKDGNAATQILLFIGHPASPEISKRNGKQIQLCSKSQSLLARSCQRVELYSQPSKTNHQARHMLRCLSQCCHCPLNQNEA